MFNRYVSHFRMLAIASIWLNSAQIDLASLSVFDCLIRHFAQ